MSDLTAALTDFKNGQFLIVTDDETRENEGDLIPLVNATCNCHQWKNVSWA